jgi:hypothetical protein
MFDTIEQTNANVDAKSSVANDDDGDKSNASRLDVVRMLSPTPRLPLFSAKLFILAWIISTMKVRCCYFIHLPLFDCLANYIN